MSYLGLITFQTAHYESRSSVKRSLAATAIALTAIVALAGCSASAPTYSAAELPTILKSAEKTLGVKGTVLDDAASKAELAKVGGTNALSGALGGAHVTYSPASCEAQMKTSLGVSAPKGGISSVLTFDTSDMLSVSSIANKSLPASQVSGTEDKLNTFINDCSKITMTIAEGATNLTAHITVKKLAATTTGDKTVGIQEGIDFALGGQDLTVTTKMVEAVKGNLVAAMITIDSSAESSSSTSSHPSATTAINAVFAAAKK